jgi:hypothetical protein
MALMHVLVWSREQRSWANLCFFVMAVGVIGLAAGELAAMYAKSPTEYGTAVRWSHFAYAFVVAGSLGFAHFYFGTGKRWPLCSALGLRLLAVVVNFRTGLNPHISAIQSLQQVNFLGEPVSILGECQVLERVAAQRVPLPAVVITGHDQPGNAERVRALGCADYLLKPLNESQLLTAIGKVIRTLE